MELPNMSVPFRQNFPAFHILIWRTNPISFIENLQPSFLTATSGALLFILPKWTEVWGHNYFRNYALCVVWRSLECSPLRSFHGFLAFFRNFCGKNRLFAIFVEKIVVFSKKKGFVRKIHYLFSPTKSVVYALCVENTERASFTLFPCDAARGAKSGGR